MPLVNNIGHRQCKRVVVILHCHSFFFFSLERVHCITVSIPMRCIVAHHGDPYAIFSKLAFQLNYESHNLTTFRFKLHTQGIVIIQKSAKFYAAHGYWLSWK